MINTKLDILQLMLLFQFKIHNAPWFFCLQFLLSNGRLGWFKMFVSSLKGFFLFAEVVSRLGCDNLDEITRDNMTCNFYASNLKHDMLTVSC